MSTTIDKLRRWVAGRDTSVEVSESRGVRLLHLGGDAIQSAIRLSQPDALELHYTRAMMGSLLFVPEPRDILMVGLGGGSIARFVHARMPATRMHVVEINPRVVVAARTYFGLPEDDNRLTVQVADGGDHIPTQVAAADILLLDAFDDGTAVKALCAESFYTACYHALRDDGVFVQNFMADEPNLVRYITRLARVFDRRVVSMPTGDRVNTMVFGLKRSARRIAIDELKRRADSLARRYPLPLAGMVTDLLETNERTTSYLKLER